MSELSSQDMLAINRCCDALEEALRRWRDSEAAESPRAESYLTDLPDRLTKAAVEQLLPIEIEYRIAAGETLLVNEFERRFPDVGMGFVIMLLQESMASDDRAASTRAELPTGTESATDSSTGTAFAHGPTDDSVPAGREPDTKNEERSPAKIGQYEIIGRLGRGGMGTVYQAVHRQMQRDVAIKVMRGDLVERPDLQKRFRREVLAAAKLVHPNVVTAYDAGEMDGRPFLVTELIDGFDLQRYVRENGPMPWSTAVRCIIDAAKGLDYAHGQNVIHRDIKPANLLMDQSGTVKILDLGLARLAIEQDDGGDETDATAQLTKTGAVMGTAGYMAPEQARNTRAADARSDVYSLGCVLFFLISGRPPYRGESVVDTILEHATAPIPELAAPDPVPDSVRQLVRSMMAKDPAERPPSMQDLIDRLQAAVAGEQSGLPTIVTDKGRAKATPKKRSADPSDVSRKETARAKSLPSRSKRSTVWNRGLAIWGFVVVGLAGLAYLIYFVATTEPKPTVPNRALVFSGDSYVHVPSIERGPGDAVTLEVIARIDQVQLSNPLSWLGGQWMALFHNGSWGISRLERGQSLFSVVDEPSDDVGGQWQHIAGTWDGTQLRIYVDGRLLRQAQIEFDLPQTEPGLFVGGVDPGRLPQGQNRRFFQGAIDAVRVTDRVLYEGERDFVPPSRLEPVEGTLVLFQFDEAPGERVFRDASGNGNDGVGFGVESTLTN